MQARWGFALGCAWCCLAGAGLAQGDAPVALQLGDLILRDRLDEASALAGRYAPANPGDRAGVAACCIAMAVDGFAAGAARRINTLGAGPDYPMLHPLAHAAYETGAAPMPYVYQDTFAIGDFHWVQRAHLYWRAADWVAGRLSDPRAKAERLLEFVYSHVDAIDSRDHGGIPEDVLISGIGTPDRSAWTLVELLRQQRVPAHIVYLYPPAGGDSNHTVAQVYLDGRWQVMDTWIGVAMRHPITGEPLDVYQLGADPKLAEQYPSYRGALARSFQRVDLLIAADASAGLPRMRRLQDAAAQMRLPHVLYVDWAAEMQHVHDTLRLPRGHGKPGVPGNKLAVWPYPMQYLYEQPDETWDQRGFRMWRAEGPFYDAARDHVAGRFDLAAEGYKVAAATDVYEAALVEYKRGLLAYDQDRFQEAVNAWSPLVDHPRLGTAKLRYLLGRAYERLGRHEQARDHYLAVPQLDAAVVRLRELERETPSAAP